MAVDFGKTAQDYARHRLGFPESFFDRLARFGVGEAGQRVVDLGTGTGTIARSLARRDCMVVGLDHSAEMMNAARALDSGAGVEIDYRVAKAEDTGLPDDFADVVTAGQCWHWFDRPRAAAEVRRILKPGGRLVIAHLDWLELPGNMVEITERLIEEIGGKDAWSTAALGTRTGLYPLWLRDIQGAELEGIETFSYDTTLWYSHKAWRGRVRASSAIGAGKLSPAAVERFDERLGRALNVFADPMNVPHRIWAVIAKKPA